ncbi:MAG TPA: quinate 5-dehydrogenase [Anaerolineae bacterium]|nr:quinate 5-dehydrogenase [Anaerolineae bacterium]
MKRAVSVSLGSATRDKVVEVELLGERVRIERIGTDGDIARAAALYAELDGQVDAFGVGGIDLGEHTPWKFYPLHDAQRMVKGVRRTPVVDGGGLKMTLEARVMQVVEREIGSDIQPKTALLVAAITRYGMTLSFVEAGYQCVFADLMFALGLPIPLRSLAALRRLAKLLLPALGRMPIAWLYPTGEKQEKNEPKYESYYQWASVTAGDFLYVKKHLPLRMDGKVIVTNTTTSADVDMLRARGVKVLVTTTPVYEGRSFGTNMLEAALVAVSGKGRPLTHAELEALIDQLKLEPQIQRL